MESIAVISDIHGNIPALDAVLGDISRRRITRIFCLGDLVGKGPAPARAVDACREACEAACRGNWDDMVAGRPDWSSTAWQRARLGEERLAYLAGLRNCIDLELAGARVRLFHASERGVYDRVYSRAADEVHEAMFRNTAFTGDAAVPEVVGYGDIHVSYVKRMDGRTLFNAGSVGNPLDMTKASYAIVSAVEADSSALVPRSGRPVLDVEIVKLDYDIERAVAEAKSSGMPELEPWIRELIYAEYRGTGKIAAEA